MKGRLTDSVNAAKWSFPCDARANKHGALKSVMNPGNKWIPLAGPGDYEEVDSTKRPDRVSWPSVPAWSVPKGEAQENVREKILRKHSPGVGPGSYNLPSPFDMTRTQRLA